MRRKNLAPGLRVRGKGDCVLLPPSVGASGIPYVYWDPEAAISAAPQWLIDSAFAGLEEQSSSKILAFPKLPSQQTSTTARPPELSCAKLLQFVSRASSLPDPQIRYIYMSFQFNRDRWQCRFRETDHTLLPRTLNLATAEEVVALADRGGGLSSLEGRQALDLAIINGRGLVFLALNINQYRQLCRPTSSNAG